MTAPQTIRIEFPDSPQVRKLLRDLSIHLHDDSVPFFLEYEDDADNRQMAEAGEQIIEAITETLLVKL